MRYIETECKQAITKLKRKHPYEWDINVYRGCEHRCQYCYAIYSHKYLDSDSYFDDIYVKTNIAERLEEQLASPSWNRELVNLGGVTDSYQRAETKYKLMPDVLKLLIKYRTPCIISTKSDLILRDYDLIDELARVAYVNIAATITTMDENVRTKIEPGGSPSLDRFQVLKEFSESHASTGLHVMPIIPYITDKSDNFELLYSNAHDANVTYVLPGVMYLRGQTKSVFFDMVERDFPDKLEQLRVLFKKGGAGKEYKDGFYAMENKIRKKYALSSAYSKPIKDGEKKIRQANMQISMFE